MKFPDVERVIYQKNPLVEVVCQCVFSRIFAIDERVPAAFQQALGANYPIVETRELVIFPMNATSDSSTSKRTQYLFSTEDRRFTIALVSEFIAVSTQNYREWPEFVRHVEAALAALSHSYAEQTFTRIGLRYIDVVRREALGLGGLPWTELIRPSALGLLGEDEIKKDDLLEFNSVTALSLDEVGKAQIRTRLSPYQDDGNALVFTIDSDFFEESPVKGRDNAVRILSAFNKEAGRAFRWFITKRLHEALEPEMRG